MSNLENAAKHLAPKAAVWKPRYDRDVLRQYHRMRNRGLAAAHRLASKRDKWRLRLSFKKLTLLQYQKFRNRGLISALSLSGKRDEWRRDVGRDVLDRAFCLDRSDHSFSVPALDWGFRLTEPQVTKTIAKLLDVGRKPSGTCSNNPRTERIVAFLQALGVKDIVAEKLYGCNISSEEKIHKKYRVDLKFDLKFENNFHRIIIIEAKFDHFLGKDQLNNYHNYFEKKYKKEHLDCEIEYFVLCLDRHKIIKGKHEKIWKFVFWKDLWRRFEKYRPEENDTNLMIFLSSLWHRINTNYQGGL